MPATAASALTRSSARTDLVEPIRDVSHAVIRHIVPHILAAGMEKSTFWPLHQLERAGEHHPSELAHRLGVSPAACTATMDALVALGYVVRRPSVEDRRQIVLRVTPKGRRALETVWRRFAASLEPFLAGLPPGDVAVTARTLTTIAARLDAELAPGEASA